MKTLKASLILLGLGLLFSINIMAQGPPNPPSDPNVGGNQSPAGPTGGAPIDSGTGILLILAAAYGFQKFRSLRVKEFKS